MRLIDADAFKDWLLNRFVKPQDTLVLTLQGFIAEQPTAYDIDKVVAELESKICTIDEDDVEIAMRNKHFRTAIEIVKQGGVSDDVCEWTQSGDMAINPHTFSKYKIKQCDGLYALSTCPYCRKKIRVVGK